MDNRFSSRRYQFNDLNSSPYQQRGRFGQGAKKKGEQKQGISYKSSPNPFPRSFANEQARKTSRAAWRSACAHICISAQLHREHGGIRGRAGGRPGPSLPEPHRASPAKRMHFGCSCEFVRASNARVHELFMRRDVGGVGGPVVRRPGGWSPGPPRATTRYSIYFAGSAHTRIRER